MKQIVIVFSLILLVSCQSKIETVYINVHALRASSLYARDSVYFYMQRYGDQNKDLARSYYEKYKSEENNFPEKAVYDLKRSISVQPTADAYKELAGLLGKLDRKEELMQLYGLFIYQLYLPRSDKNGSDNIYIFGPPDEETYYEYLVATIQRQNILYAEDIYTARDFNFNMERIKEKIIADARIKMDRNSEEFKNILLQFLPYEELESIAMKPGSFQNFLTSIKDTGSRFSINQLQAREFNYERFNGIEGFDMGMQIDFDALNIFYLKEKQDNKNSWIKFNFKRHYEPFPSIHAIVYAIDTSETACPIEMRHVYHRLVTYDDTGGILDSKVISLQSGEDLMTAEVDEANISTSLYKRVWKTPYKKEDFDNSLVETKLLGSKKMTIQADGSILEELAEVVR